MFGFPMTRRQPKAASLKKKPWWRCYTLSRNFNEWTKSEVRARCKALLGWLPVGFGHTIFKQA